MLAPRRSFSTLLRISSDIHPLRVEVPLQVFLQRQQLHKMRPAQFSRQCRDNLVIGKQPLPTAPSAGDLRRETPPQIPGSIRRDSVEKISSPYSARFSSKISLRIRWPICQCSATSAAFTPRATVCRAARISSRTSVSNSCGATSGATTIGPWFVNRFVFIRIFMANLLPRLPPAAAGNPPARVSA